MIQTSQAWKEYSKDYSVFHPSGTLVGSETIQLDETDFMMGGCTFNDSVSGMTTISLGGVVTNSCNLTLNNTEGKFDNFDFNGAVFTMRWSVGNETITRGVYTIEKPRNYGATIQLIGYDLMDKLNKYYIGEDGNGEITFPISAKTLISGLCDYCGVPYESDFFKVTDTTIQEFEYDESTTCRQVISWVLEIVGAYARMSNLGKFTVNPWFFGWEKVGYWEGGYFVPWEQIANVDGGTFQPWSVVIAVDGGEMSVENAYELLKIATVSVGVDDIAVTGVRAYAYNTVDEFQFSTAGDSGYLLSIVDNRLVNETNTQNVANTAWSTVSGLKVRPFEMTSFGDPSIEAGDAVIIRDYKGNYYASVITSLSYTVGNERIVCEVETPEANSLEMPNPETQVIKGATYAAYDYIKAKKISADYVSAGTLEGSVIAKNFTMEGGSINILTSDSASNIILLRSGLSQIALSPNRIDMQGYNGDGANAVLDYEVATANPKITLRLNDDTHLGLELESTGDITTYGEATFNGVVNIGGTPVADHVKEQGTAGAFRYRLWNSGFKEYWIVNYSLGTVNFATQYGALYYYTSPTYSWLNTLPSFESNPSVHISAFAPLGLIFASVKSITYSDYSFYLANDHQGNFDVSISVYICGK